MSRLRRIALALLILVATGVFVFWQLTRVAPTWYEPPDPTSHSVIMLADQFEYGVLETAQKIRAPSAAGGATAPPSEWSVRVTQLQINSWLSARLPQWLANQGEQWPQQLGTPQVRIEPEGISIALPLGEEGSQRTIVVRVMPRLVGDKLRLEVNQVAMGRIPLPGEPLSNLAEAFHDSAPQVVNDPRVQPFIALLSGRGGEQQIDPVFRLSDDRLVRLRSLKLGDAWVDCTAETIAEP